MVGSVGELTSIASRCFGVQRSWSRLSPHVGWWYLVGAGGSFLVYLCCSTKVKPLESTLVTQPLLIPSLDLPGHRGPDS